MRVCSGAGRLRAVDDAICFCDECRPVPAAPSDGDGIRSHTLTDRERYARLYSESRWQRTRDRAVRLMPLCARCELRYTEIIDHVVPAGIAIAQAIASGLYVVDRSAGFFFMSNLQGLSTGSPTQDRGGQGACRIAGRMR